MCSGRVVALRKICINSFHSSIFHTLPKFFHTFALTRYILYSFQELRITLSLLLTKKIYCVGLKLLMFFAVVKSTAMTTIAVAVSWSRSKFGPRYYLC